MRSGLLRLRDLRVSFPGDGEETRVVRGLDLRLGEGEAVGLVGESGCGKSLTALSILGLVPPPGWVSGGSIQWEGREIVRNTPLEFRKIRGREVGMVFQDPSTSLNPVFTIGFHLAEALRTCGLRNREEIRRRSVDLLRQVGVSAPESRLGSYPGQLSGGLRQRTLIAIAIACRPKLLIADEPTTALDVTIQAQIMAVLKRLREERGMALLLITHDLGLVAQNVARVVVMYAGLAVEEASTEQLFLQPLHPYTAGLMGSIPGAKGVERGGPLRAIPGAVPDPSVVPSGCPFRDRCPIAIEACGLALPPLEDKASGRRVRCLRVERLV